MIDSVVEAPASAYLDSNSAALYMGFHNVRAFRQWARRLRIKARRRFPGRVLLWKQKDLDAFVQDDAISSSSADDRPVTPPPETSPPPRRGRPRRTQH